MLLPRIGLEVHVQIATLRKLFSEAPVPKLNSIPNSCVSPFDAALPGTLPVLSKECVVAGIRAATVLSSNISFRSEFDRKHYFYFDMPAGYQITQHRHPIATSGSVDFYVHTKALAPYQKCVRIERIQLEQDSGKSVHDAVTDRTLIDLNRAGIALLEIVTKPTLRSGLEAVCFVDELLATLKLARVTHARAEHGEYRVDANVSIDDGEHRYPRVEVKNLTGLKFVQNAIEFETERQLRLLKDGQLIERETRHFDPKSGAKGETYRLRLKEDLFDYRYMPEPNLPPLRLTQERTESQPSDILAIDQVTADMIGFSTPCQLADSWIRWGANPNHAVVLALSDTWRTYATKVVEAERQAVSHSLTFIWLRLRPWLEATRLKVDKLHISPDLAVKLSCGFRDRHFTEAALPRIFAYANSIDSSQLPSFTVPSDMLRILDKTEIDKLVRGALNDPIIAKEAKRAHPSRSKRKAAFYADLIQDRFLPLVNGNVEFDDWDEALRRIYYDC